MLPRYASAASLPGDVGLCVSCVWRFLGPSPWVFFRPGSGWPFPAARCAVLCFGWFFARGYFSLVPSSPCRVGPQEMRPSAVQPLSHSTVLRLLSRVACRPLSLLASTTELSATLQHCPSRFHMRACWYAEVLRHPHFVAKADFGSKLLCLRSSRKGRKPPNAGSQNEDTSIHIWVGAR